MKKKKVLVIVIIIAVVVAVIGVIVLLSANNKNRYRIIKVYEINGDATVLREDIGEINAYENMVLESGDMLNLSSGTMTLQLDDDKYIYMEEGTEIQLVAEGNAENSKTSIQLNKGEITNEIQNKLSADSAYEVNTPNATMSVRGTIFYVKVYEGEDGKLYTKVCVLDGNVETNLIYADGRIADSSKILKIGKGNQIIIFEDDTTTDYLGGMTDIDYDDLPEDIRNRMDNEWSNIIDYLEAQASEQEDSIPENPGPFTVTFMYGDTMFGTQTVEKGDTAKEPSLMPEPDGSWDFDFNTKIYEDTVIEWNE